MLSVGIMTKKNKKILILVFVVFATFKATIAMSQCSISATSIVFSNYDVFSNIPVDSAGTISISCSKEVTKAFVTIGTSSGSGTINPRKMKLSSGNDFLDYNIFSDVTRTAVLGNTPIEFRRPSGKPAPWSESFSIYARIPPGQDVSFGSYSDSVSVSVDW